MARRSSAYFLCQLAAVVLIACLSSLQGVRASEEVEKEQQAALNDEFDEAALEEMVFNPMTTSLLRDKRDTSCKDRAALAEKVRAECTKDIDAKFGNFSIWTKKYFLSREKYLKKQLKKPGKLAVVDFDIALPLACYASCVQKKLNLTHANGTVNVNATSAFYERSISVSYKNKKPLNMTIIRPLVAGCAANHFAYSKPLRAKINFKSFGDRPGYSAPVCMSNYRFQLCVLNGFLKKILQPLINEIVNKQKNEEMNSVGSHLPKQKDRKTL